MSPARSLGKLTVTAMHTEPVCPAPWQAKTSLKTQGVLMGLNAPACLYLGKDESDRGSVLASEGAAQGAQLQRDT